VCSRDRTWKVLCTIESSYGVNNFEDFARCEKCEMCACLYVYHLDYGGEIRWVGQTWGRMEDDVEVDVVKYAVDDVMDGCDARPSVVSLKAAAVYK
jgi:hypothetical protein